MKFLLTVLALSSSVLVHAVAPRVSIDSAPMITRSNQTAYTISGTCSENTRTVDLDIGRVTSLTTCVRNTWQTTVNMSAVFDQPALPITANHQDAQGNQAPEASATVVKDTSLEE